MQLERSSGGRTRPNLSWSWETVVWPTSAWVSSVLRENISTMRRSSHPHSDLKWLRSWLSSVLASCYYVCYLNLLTCQDNHFSQIWGELKHKGKLKILHNNDPKGWDWYFCAIFSSVCLVFDEYEKIAEMSIEDSIKNELSGDFERLMLAVGRKCTEFTIVLYVVTQHSA